MPLHFEHWETEDPKAIVVIVHGLGEFCGRYAWVATRFNEAGYAVLGADLPGHGSTPGLRGHIRRFEVLLDALDEVIAVAEKHYPHLPVILLGHSMGGLIIVRHIQTRELPSSVKAVLLSSPALQTNARLAPAHFLRGVLRLVSLTWPTLTRGRGVDPDLITRSHDAKKVYSVSSLILSQVSMRFLDEFLTAQDKAMTAAPVRLNIPLFIAQAGEDRLVSPSAARRFFDKLKSEQKYFRLYEGCYHELFNEPERETILQDLIEWLNSRNL